MDNVLTLEPDWSTADSAGVRTSGASTAGAAPRSAQRALVVNESVLVGVVTPQGAPSTCHEPMPDRDVVRTEPSVVAVPQLTVGSDRFNLLQEWEGTVRSIDARGVVAVLRDLTDPSRPDEEVAFGVDEVAPDDRPLVSAGAIFYWSIGYRTSPFGQVERVSTIKFRRLPAWSRRDIRRIEERTRELMERFGLSSEATRPQGQ